MFHLNFFYLINNNTLPQKVTLRQPTNPLPSTYRKSRYADALKLIIEEKIGQTIASEIQQRFAALFVVQFLPASAFLVHSTEEMSCELLFQNSHLSICYFETVLKEPIDGALTEHSSAIRQKYPSHTVHIALGAFPTLKLYSETRLPRRGRDVSTAAGA